MAELARSLKKKRLMFPIAQMPLIHGSSRNRYHIYFLRQIINFSMRLRIHSFVIHWQRPEFFAHFSPAAEAKTNNFSKFNFSPAAGALHSSYFAAAGRVLGLSFQGRGSRLLGLHE